MGTLGIGATRRARKSCSLHCNNGCGGTPLADQLPSSPARNAPPPSLWFFFQTNFADALYPRLTLPAAVPRGHGVRILDPVRREVSKPHAIERAAACGRELRHPLGVKQVPIKTSRDAEHVLPRFRLRHSNVLGIEGLPVVELEEPEASGILLVD